MENRKRIYALVFIFLALAGFSLFLNLNSDFRKAITGFASNSQTGQVNITISTTISINMSRSNITWGNGTIDLGQQNATLYTSQENAAVLRGNWPTANAKAFILANVGNINCSLTLSGGKTAAGLIGGTNPQYQWNVSNKDEGSCYDSNVPLNGWYDVNSSAKFCSQLGFISTGNEVYIDILLTIPNNANKTGEQTDIITASASTAG